MHTTTQDKRAGQSIVEISLLLALVSITALVGLNLVGVNLNAVFCRIATGLGADETCAPIIASTEPPDVPEASAEPIKMEDFCQGPNPQSRFQPVDANDYQVTLDQAIKRAGDGHDIFFRATNTTIGPGDPKKVGSLNGYSLRYTPSTKDKGTTVPASIAIVKWTGGNRVTPDLETLTLPDGYGAGNNIMLNVTGDTFIVTVDGKEVIRTKDSTYNTGDIGFLTNTAGTEVCFNNVLIQPLD